MSTARVSHLSFAAASNMPHPFPASPPVELPIVIRSHIARRPAGFAYDKTISAAGVFLACAALAFGAGFFGQQWWKDLKKASGVERLVVRPVKTAEQRRSARTKAPVKATPVAVKKKPDNKPPSPAAQNPGANGQALDAARQHLKTAIEKARSGSLAEARALARRASKALPDESEGLNLMIDYFESYPALADEARIKLNGNSEVDLGKPWGKAQFVEQGPDTITFFVQGKHKRFTLQQFNELAGVRFRVTRDYLDRAASPTNHLILGASLFLMNIDENGHSTTRDACDAARRRFQKAITSNDRVSREDGTVMMKALALDKRK